MSQSRRGAASGSLNPQSSGCRVLHLVQGVAVGGMEQVVLQLARTARQAGFDDRLLLYDTPAGRGEPDLDVGDVPVTFLPRRMGVDWGFGRRLAGQLRAMGARLVHAHNDTALFYAALALTQMRGRQPGLIVTFHNAPVSLHWSSRLGARWASGRARFVVAVSPELRQFLLAKGWAASGVVIANGVDLSRFSPEGAGGGWRARLNLPEGTFLVGHVGRFDANKRQSDLLAAARLVQQKLPQAAFVFVGQGAGRDEVERAAGGDPRIRFLSRVPDVPAFLRELDAFVICSRHEGAPLALLEAMACARPVIATEVGGIPDILSDRLAQCGLAVPPSDPVALAGAVAELAASREWRLSLGRRARQQVIERFSWERTVADYEKLYARI